MTSNPSLQLPGQHSTVAAEVDWLYYFIYWISVAFFVAIVGAMLWFVYKYRRSQGAKSEPTGHHPYLEWGWTLGPILLLIPMFHWGFKTYVANAIAPADAFEIRVRGRKWLWEFEYPNGVTAIGELKVPVGKPIKLVMSSDDVIHSFFIPTFRIKKDVVPGMYTTLWFQATEVGEQQVFCAEYCGTSHSGMLAKILVVPEAEFQTFLTEGVTMPAGITTPEAWGEKLYTQNACVTCHTLDGSPKVGPSFKGVWGRTETFEDGTTTVIDENYVRESILKPQAKIVKGYKNLVMPPYALHDKQIDALIAFLKTLK